MILLIEVEFSLKSNDIAGQQWVMWASGLARCRIRKAAAAQRTSTDKKNGEAFCTTAQHNTTQHRPAWTSTTEQYNGAAFCTSAQHNAAQTSMEQHNGPAWSSLLYNSTTQRSTEQHNGITQPLADNAAQTSMEQQNGQVQRSSLLH